MASSKDYLQFVLEQLSELQEITYRAMMGEFIIYYRGKIVGPKSELTWQDPEYHGTRETLWERAETTP